MTKVIAALDNSLAAKPTLAAALALGRLLGADSEAVHVAVDGARVAKQIAEDTAVPLRVLPGKVIESLLAEGRAEDVAAVVLGARSTPGGRRPVGATALAVATSLAKPVVIVPPDAAPGNLERVLVPVEGVSPSLTPLEIIALAKGTAVEVVVLHVHEEESLPAFTDQLQHEQPEWAQEFLRRYCPWGIGTVRLERRVGRTEELVPAVAEQVHADLIALGWTQELAEGRAPVIRAALARSRVPIMLVPVETPTSKEEPWSRLQLSPA